ncbi:MAG: hypothetical protein OCD01_20290, partial [Fibrobacterales bacterium]
FSEVYDCTWGVINAYTSRTFATGCTHPVRKSNISLTKALCPTIQMRKNHQSLYYRIKKLRTYSI